MSNFTKVLRFLVKGSNSQAALDVIDAFAEDKNKELQDTVILFHNRLNALARNNSEKLITHEAAEIEFNQINKGILALIDEIDGMTFDKKAAFALFEQLSPNPLEDGTIELEDEDEKSTSNDEKSIGNDGESTSSDEKSGTPKTFLSYLKAYWGLILGILVILYLIFRFNFCQSDNTVASNSSNSAPAPVNQGVIPQTQQPTTVVSQGKTKGQLDDEKRQRYRDSLRIVKEKKRQGINGRQQLKTLTDDEIDEPVLYKTDVTQKITSKSVTTTPTTTIKPKPNDVKIEPVKETAPSKKPLKVVKPPLTGADKLKPEEEIRFMKKKKPEKTQKQPVVVRDTSKATADTGKTKAQIVSKMKKTLDSIHDAHKTLPKKQ